ncbi:MAG: hypothetical protein HGA31_02720 [Candidatus Moranbacteria bacterium]|nr:hypothetical protein [Candidatus Moranbacteria bacterium]
MYWIFFALFVVAAMIPEIIRGSIFSLHEEVAETIIVFLLGVTGFLMFFLKEKSMLRHVREKILLQREKSDITKDLSESYSYIGETNRKLDLMRNFISSIPDADVSFRKGKPDPVYRSFSKMVHPFCRTDSFVLRIIDTERKNVEKEIRVGKCRPCVLFDADRLLSLEKSLNEEDGCVIVRSPKRFGPYVSFLMFPKAVNGIEDEPMLETIATEGLVLFSLERHFPGNGNGGRTDAL